MIELDPKQWTVPLFVGVGLVISQLFIYGKKVKRRIKITAAELTGDVMQFGVRMVITIGTIRFIEFVTTKTIDDMWQVVAATILICTSFDTYFVKIREIALTRVVGAAGVLFGRLPADALVEIGAGTDEEPGAMKVTSVTGMDKLNDAALKGGLPLRRTFMPQSGEKDQEGTISLLDKLDNSSGDNVNPTS